MTVPIVVRAPAATLPPDQQALVEQLLQGATGDAARDAAIEAQSCVDVPMPLSYEQERLWTLVQFAPGQPIYNECYTVVLPQPLDRAALQRALDEIVRRHAIWRTRFEMRDGEPAQIAMREARFPLTTLDGAALGGEDAAARTAAVRRAVDEDARRLFDLGAGPLVRGLLVDGGGLPPKLYLTAHHLVSDGLSLYNVFLPELASLYDAFSRGGASPLPEPALQFPDFARWQRAVAREGDLADQLAFWDAHLTNARPLSLPSTASSPAAPRVQHVFPASLWRHIEELCQAERATPFMFVFAVFGLVISKLTNEQELVVALPIAVNKPEQCRGMIGMFANTVAVRLTLAGDPTFAEVLQQVRAAVLDAADRPDVPFDRVVKHVASSAADGPRYFQAVCTLQRRAPDEPRALGFHIVPLEADTATAKSDVAVLFDERDIVDAGGSAGTTLAATLQHRQGAFPPGVAPRLLEFIETAALQALKMPGVRMSDLTLLSPADQRVVAEMNDTGTPFPGDRGIHRLVEDRAHETPTKIAIEADGATMTYSALDLQARGVAAALRALGVGGGSRVALVLDRSIDFVVCALGTMKAGAAYVPINPATREGRMQTLLADVQPSVIVASPEQRIDVVGDAVLVSPAELQQGAVDATCETGAAGGGAPACVFYTSGSTGTPKGVLVPHRGIARLVVNNTHAPIDASDRVAHVGNVAFDASTYEIWGALANGATLVVLPPEVALSPIRLAAAIRDRRLSTLLLTTPVFNGIARERPDAFTGMRLVMFGGEAADAAACARVRQHSAGVRLLNVYGPTETTTFASTYEIASGDVPDPVPIGRPIANTTMYVLGSLLQRKPVGVAGELCIGGPGVALGYINQPATSAARFVPNPYGPGLLYRTGDRARVRRDGNIEFLGRMDGQLKIRGYRVEPAEIEAVLARHASVTQAIVVDRRTSSGEERLCAWIQPSRDADTSSLPENLRAFAAANLPDYMVPSMFAVAAKWPLAPTGKIDRRALQTAALPDRAQPKIAPRNVLEGELVQVWQDALKVSAIGVRDNFFDLGGHSMLVPKLLAEIERSCGRRVSISTLLHDPTIEALATSILEDGDHAMVPPVVAARRDGAGVPLVYVHGDYNGYGLYCRHLRDALGATRPLYLVHPHGLNGEPIPPDLRTMARQRLSEIRKLVPHGPYALGGYCHGAFIAVEMARELVRDGERVESLVLLGPPPLDKSLRWVEDARARVSGQEHLRSSRAADWFVQARHIASGGAFALVARALRSAWSALSGAAGHGVTAASAGDTERSRRFLAGYGRAVRAYVPRAYDGRVHVIVPERSVEATVAGRWAQFASEAIVRRTPGDHTTCLTTHVRDTVREIVAALPPVCETVRRDATTLRAS